MTASDNDLTLWDWRAYFTKANLLYGEQDAKNKKLTHFTADPKGHWAKGLTDGLFVVEVRRAPASYDEYLRYPDWRQLRSGKYYTGQNASSSYYSCSCAQGQMGTRCRHLACLMFCWEAQHGPFVMTEDEQARAERLRREREEEDERIRKAREQALIKHKKSNRSNALDYIIARVNPAPSALFFSPDRILKKTGLQTDQYETELADRMIASDACHDLSVALAYDDREEQVLKVSGRVDQDYVEMTIDPSRITRLSCGCNRSYLHPYAYWYSDSEHTGRMCGHALCAWYRARERIILENPGDRTDYRGFQLLSQLTGEPVRGEKPSLNDEVGPGKQQNLILTPRITTDRNSDSLKLSFDLGRVGQKAFAVKSLESLLKSVEGETGYSLSKTLTLNFSEEQFAESSMPWYQLIASRVRAVKSVNSRLSSGYSYYGQGRKLSVGAGIPLEESDLDIVYDMAAGGHILYQYGSRSEVCSVRVGEGRPRAEIRLDPVRSGKSLVGIALSGAMPRLLRGNQYQYILDRDCFGRVADDELAFLRPFQSVSDSSGNINCVIGEKKFTEFYYRILPRLQNTPQLHLTDNVSSLIEALVPPEPKFTFYIDLADKLSCHATVQYGEQVFPLTATPDSAEARDRDQETRVFAALRNFFFQNGGDGQTFYCPADEDNLMWILTDGVRELSQYGEVKGSDAFQRVHVRSVPQPRFSVRVEGGLLDLSVKTKDLSDDELLELLASYRLRKRWHRLKSGDFVDLSDPSFLDELNETAQAMDMRIEDLLNDGVQIPRYRALYVEKLLETHNDIAASRDRHFKTLIRSFQTIKDSDFEASEALMEVLRPYQLYGFRWLSTLSQAGFGGILADEMGLGKTVQMLAHIQMLRDHGEQRPALIICPASLVYNWREESRKFTPELGVKIIAGTLSQRKALLKATEDSADLYITSYDLLKRDIALYDQREFSTIVLDEAQYIKNQKAAVSKAVRVLKAEHRFALTGTPIENRLSELWSIFDFLMPGFLYSATEFATRFEGPIMKQKDPAATAALARMTEPFILRRKKADVLKDLPEKLEESRCAELAENQRKLYDAQLVRMKNLLETSGNSGEDKLRILAEITRLRQICCDPSLLFEGYKGPSAKREACLELIQSALDAGHRMLVFSQFTSMLSLLAADLEAANIPFYTLTGATLKQERIRLVNAFNDSDVPVFLISLKAGGTGLNLTGADVVIHYDPWWNLAVQNQATDRAHRIGQTRQVTVIKLIAADTIEEKIVELQETKRDLAEAILTGQNTSLMSLSREELLELLG